MAVLESSDANYRITFLRNLPINFVKTNISLLGEALCLIAYGITQMMKKRKENPVFSINESPFVE
jgi:hypothetical protein